MFRRKKYHVGKDKFKEVRYVGKRISRKQPQTNKFSEHSRNSQKTRWKSYSWSLKLEDNEGSSENREDSWKSYKWSDACWLWMDLEPCSSPQPPAIAKHKLVTVLLADSTVQEWRKLREQESANDTHHAHSKTRGSRPGTSIYQKHVLESQHILAKYIRYFKLLKGKLVTVTDLGIFLANLMAVWAALKMLLPQPFRPSKTAFTKTHRRKVPKTWQIAILQIYWCVIQNGYHLTLVLQVKLKGFRKNHF